MTDRRRFIAAAPALLAGVPWLAACSQEPESESYASVAVRTWRLGSSAGTEGTALGLELVRCATLAPSSHNTQCWKFELRDKAITILPDLSRRCPAVDPDDHHIFVSLGCATENLVQAASAHGQHAQALFDSEREAVRVTLERAATRASTLFDAIASRQCTRGDYDGKPLPGKELALLERAGTSSGVRVLLFTSISTAKA